MRVQIEHSNLGRIVKIFLFTHKAHSTINYTVEDSHLVANETQHDVATVPPEEKPFLEIPFTLFPEFITAMVECADSQKIETKQITYKDGEHAATLKHLADMKELVHKFIDK